MATATNHYKLGLFVIVGFAAAILAGVLLGGARSRRSTTQYHSYFNESVQGLELGAPVKFRGVTIGHVSAIDIAPDHRMIDVVSELDTEKILHMGLAESGRKHGAERFAIPPDLRTQLNSQGITGVKFVAIDFFDVTSNPPPPVPFPIPANHYIPAASSMMKNLEDTITQAMDRLPEMVDAVVMIMGRVDGLLATLETQDVSGKAVTTLSHADAVMTTMQSTLERLDKRDLGGRAVTTLGHADAVMMTMQSTLGRIDKQDLGGRAASTLADLDVAVTKINELLDALGGQQGLLAGARRATDAFGELGRAGRGTQRDLETTLRDVGEAAEAIRALAEAIERDPDMLLKGKAVR